MRVAQDPETGRFVAGPTPVERFLARVSEGPGGCWLWQGGIASNGYGRFWLGDGTTGAHQAAHLLFKGPIPEGLTIDHLCRVRHCVNPAHLEAVTIGENWRRATRLVTHCPQGHPYDEANTYVGRNRCRICRRCHAAGQREYMRRRRARGVVV